MMEKLAANDRRVANIQRSDFTYCVFPDGTTLGDSVLQLDDSRPLADGFHVSHMPAGMATRPHRHSRAEQLLILNGTFVDSDGSVFKESDLPFYQNGSEHSSHAHDGCLFAVFISNQETSL
jgi:anti-sigma factor ChrR (cupin superfamily)